jgi:hypothetical protein
LPPRDSKYNARVWAVLCEIVNTLGKEGMSTNSDCDEQYAARPSVWRNKKVGEFMKELDRIYRESRAGKRGAIGKRVYREEEAIVRKGPEWWDSCVARTEVVTKLPRCVYDEPWLKKMESKRKEWAKETLRPKSTPVWNILL